MASQTPSRTRAVLGILSGISAALWAGIAHAAVFGGTSVQDGIAQAAGIGGISSETSVVQIVLMVINAILLIVLILAVLVIVIAGLYLILSNGDEGQKDKAKKIIFYCIIGIIVILISRVIVMYVNNLFG
jgi:hypothetical protein